MTNVEQIQQNLLGLCMKDKEVFLNHALRLDEDHFTTPIYKEFFNLLKKTYTETDTKEFEISLIRSDKLSQDLMISAAADLLSSMGLKSNAYNYVKILIEDKLKRDLSENAKEIEEMISAGKSIDEITDKMSRAAIEAQDERTVDFGSSPAKYFETLYEKVMELKGKPFGFLTGWKQFDEALGGMERGTVTTVAARPSMGKTAFGVNIAHKLEENGAKVLFFSAEMSGEDLSSRFMPFETHIGTKYNKDYEYLEKAEIRRELVHWGMEKLSQKNIKVDDTPALTIENIVYKMPRYTSEGYNVFIIDYVQFIQMKGKIGQDSDHRRISHIMATLKTLAKKYNVSIIVLAQIGRGIESRDDKRPMLSDLKGSGSIEENSDKVVAIHREWFYLGGFSEPVMEKKKNKIQPSSIIILKNRNGSMGDIPFWYYMDYNAFKEAEYESDSKGNETPKVPPILNYEQYINLFVHPMRHEKEMEMKLEKGKITQMEYDDWKFNKIPLPNSAEKIVNEFIEEHPIEKIEKPKPEFKQTSLNDLFGAGNIVEVKDEN